MTEGWAAIDYWFVLWSNSHSLTDHYWFTLQTTIGLHPKRLLL